MLEETGNKISEEIGQEKENISESKSEIKEIEDIPKKPVKGGRLFVKGISGNPKGRPKSKGFSLRDDLIKSLIRIKRKDPLKYQSIIDSYWSEKGMRQFLLEIVDGKARQSVEMSGTMENPIRIIEIKPMDLPQKEE